MSFFESIKSAFPDPVEFWEKIVSAAPSVLAAIALLLAGHFIGRFLAFAVTRILQRVGLDMLGQRAGLDDMAARGGFELTASSMLGKIIYWLVFLTFIISAADAIGLDRVSTTVENFVAYLPKVVGALLVTVIGLFAAQLVRTVVETALASINLGYERVVGGLLYTIILVVVISLAIGQLDIETDLLNQVVSIMLMACAASIALALGLGTRDVAGNVVAGVYARDLYPVGATVTIDNVSGTVVEVGATCIVIDNGAGRNITIPNAKLLDSQVEISH